MVSDDAQYRCNNSQYTGRDMKEIKGRLIDIGLDREGSFAESLFGSTLVCRTEQACILIKQPITTGLVTYRGIHSTPGAAPENIVRPSKLTLRGAVKMGYALCKATQLVRPLQEALEK